MFSMAFPNTSSHFKLKTHKSQHLHRQHSNITRPVNIIISWHNFEIWIRDDNSQSKIQSGKWSGQKKKVIRWWWWSSLLFEKSTDLFSLFSHCSLQLFFFGKRFDLAWKNLNVLIVVKERRLKIESQDFLNVFYQKNQIVDFSIFQNSQI